MVPFGLGIFLGVINKNKWKAFSMWTLVQPTEFQPHLATDSFMIWGKSLHLSASQFSFWQSQGVDGPWRFQNWGERHGLWWSWKSQQYSINPTSCIPTNQQVACYSWDSPRLRCGCAAGSGVVDAPARSWVCCSEAGVGDRWKWWFGSCGQQKMPIDRERQILWDTTICRI